MRIAVIGAGIVGLSTAFELARDGHQVTVFERRGAAAEEASFACAGVLSPGLPGQLIGGLFSRHATLKVGFPQSPGELAWLWRRHRAQQPERASANRSSLQDLAVYSRDRLHRISADLKLEYERSDGHLVLLRSDKASKLIQSDLQRLRDSAIAFQEIDPVQARKIETALNPDTPFFGAVYFPEHEVGNCRQFALLLKNEAQRLGVQFRFNTRVTQIQSATGIALALEGESAAQAFDAAVLCAGLDSVRLLAALGLNIALLPMHGYSVSATIRESLNAPRSVVTDQQHQVSISRLGKRVRVTGGAELGGTPNTKSPAALATLYKVLRDWFPGAASLSGGVQEWKGARTMLPDGLPILGASGIAGVWLNLGHGTEGWALSCGSARILADLIGGTAPGPDISALGISRISR